MILRERPAIGVGHGAARDGNLGGDEHAVGDGLAMSEPLVFRDGLEGVAGRMAEVQHPARARFALVEPHDGGLDGAGLADDRHERVGFPREDGVHVAVDAIEEARGSTSCRT